MVIHVNHWRVDIPHTVAKQINGHHGQSVLVFALLDDVFLSVVLRTKILSESQRLRFQPCFLQLDENQMLMPVVFADCGSEVNAEHGDAVARGVDIFVRTLLHLYHLLLQ